MHTSSDCIAHLAGALAKAQAELVNPPKTCRAILEPGRGGEEGKTFHYAPLSAGLDIVRKTLGKHDIAVVQATEVDQESGTVMLTTTLAHGSGQWIAAQWPVCRVADMAQPKLMGAALTYARRYGLFTLVGIAGEDDLNAPDVTSAAGEDSRVEVADGATKEPKRSSVSRARRPLQERHARGRVRGAIDADGVNYRVARPAPLPQERSSRAPDPISSLANVTSTEGLLQWALDILPLRHTLSDKQRAELDAAFVERAESLGADPEWLLAFGRPPSPGEGQTLSPTSPTIGGDHDAQASA